MAMGFHEVIKTGVRLRRLCTNNGLRASYDRKLQAWAITRSSLMLPADQSPDEWSTEYLLDEQLATLTAHQMITTYRPTRNTDGIP